MSGEKRRGERPERKPLTVKEYFFRRDGDVLVARKDLVTREEFWNVLKWYDTQIFAANAWYRVFWRWLIRYPIPGRFNIEALAGLVQVVQVDQKGEPEPVAPKKRIDAIGNVVEVES